ncbi:MAG: hypothetical protein ABSH34_31040 [Verrucomicrobiota bacterium]|jgi:hypothetical protein
MRGRGIDFEHRFNTSRWAEGMHIQSLNQKRVLIAARYGISTVVPEGEDLVYGQSEFKEPDLLVFRSERLSEREREILGEGALSWNDRLALDTDGQLPELLNKAFVALEVEFSPYKAGEMKDRHWQPRSESRWLERPLKNAVAPTAPNIWVKAEDLDKLVAWQKKFNVPIIVAHLFDQEAFAVALSRVEAFRRDYQADPKGRVRLQVTTGIFAKDQRYDRVDASGASEVKPVFIITPAVATKIGNIRGVKVSAQLGVSASMKYVSHVIFSGGEVEIADDFVDFLLGLENNGARSLR